MTNWPVAGGTVRDVPTERNLRDIRRRGGELESASLSKKEAKELFPQLPSKSSVKTLWGRVSSAAVKLGGSEGWTVSKVSAGIYKIAISPELGSTATCTFNVFETTNRLALRVGAASKTEVQVIFTGLTFEVADSAFTFHIFG